MITSTANQQMKSLSALMKKAKERKNRKAFVVEGIKMFLEAPKESVISVYAAESFLAEEKHRKMLEGYSYEVVSDAVFRSVSDTQTPQGILAVVRIPEYRLEDLLCDRKTHLLILEGIQDPGNLGTMVRTGEGAGISGIIMNRTTVDLFNPKTIRSTMGSIYRVPYYIAEDLGSTIRQLQAYGVFLYAAHLKGEAAYDAFDYTKPSGHSLHSGELFALLPDGYGAVGENADIGVPADYLGLRRKVLGAVRNGVKVRHGADGGVAAAGGGGAARFYALLIKKSRLAKMNVYVAKTGENSIFGKITDRKTSFGGKLERKGLVPETGGYFDEIADVFRHFSKFLSKK